MEFLKRMCVSPAFVAGEVETGYIQKHQEELFEPQQIPPELYIQAAVGLYLDEQNKRNPTQSNGWSTGLLGFGASLQPQSFSFAPLSLDGKPVTSSTTVKVRQNGDKTFEVSVGEAFQMRVTSSFDPSSRVVQSFMPHTRMETRLIKNPSTNHLMMFQQGQQYRLQLVVPKWAEKALGMKDVTNSVLAPMPCKVLRVEVEEGAQVKKNEPLVVIESMKMETVIRAPQDGVISRIVHRAGDLCKAGTALVEFAGE